MFKYKLILYNLLEERLTFENSNRIPQTTAFKHKLNKTNRLLNVAKLDILSIGALSQSRRSPLHHPLLALAPVVTCHLIENIKTNILHSRLIQLE